MDTTISYMDKGVKQLNKGYIEGVLRVCEVILSFADIAVSIS